MIGKAMSFVSSSVLWLGFFFVLYGVGIVLKSDSRRYLRDSELLKIVTELTATWRTKTRGFIKTVWVTAVCLFAVGAFITIPLKHIVLPAKQKVAHYWFLPHVPEIMADNEYVVLLLDKDDPLYGTRPRYTFCAMGKSIPFNEGELIKDIVFKEHDDCKEIINFNMERDEHYRTKHYGENEYPKEAYNHGYGR